MDGREREKEFKRYSKTDCILAMWGFVFVGFVASGSTGWREMSSESFHDQKSLGTAGLEHFETPS